MTTSSDQPFRFMVILTFEIKTGVLPPVAPVSNNYGVNAFKVFDVFTCSYSSPRHNAHYFVTGLISETDA